MKVLCCHTDYQLRPETQKALLLATPKTEFVDVTGDWYGYWQAIQDRWTGEENLVVVEQDMVITPEVIETFGGCDQSWCTYAYQLWGFNHTYWSLGCTMFSAELQRKFPEIPKTMYSDLDRIIREMLWPTEMPHMHGVVEHLHKYLPFPPMMSNNG